MAAKKATEALRCEIETRLRAGETRTGICRALDLSPKTLKRWLEEWAAEHPEPVKELSPDEIETARQMLNLGMGVRQITIQLWRDRKRRQVA